MTKDRQDKQKERYFWDKVARERIYAAFDDREYLQIFDTALEMDLAGKVIVDIGCASGVSSALLASRGARVLGIDISEDLIEQAKRTWKAYEPEIDFSTGDAEHLNIESNTVDACFLGGVLHHFPKRMQVFAEILRVLRSTGKIIAVEPNRLDIMERIEWMVAGWRGKLSPNEFPINPYDMQAELESTGFVGMSFRTIRIDIPVLAQIPIVRNAFNRQKGFWLKNPILRFINAFRPPAQQGTFFVMEAVKP
jgi:SAM-dependent methyltransferase